MKQDGAGFRWGQRWAQELRDFPMRSRLKGSGGLGGPSHAGSGHVLWQCSGPSWPGSGAEVSLELSLGGGKQVLRHLVRFKA